MFYKKTRRLAGFLFCVDLCSLTEPRYQSSVIRLSNTRSCPVTGSVNRSP
jgi:hypothetical protein